jgi:hypothetical protein
MMYALRQNPYLPNAVLITKFRLKHRNLADNELDKLVKKTFRIDQATLRELDGVGDLITVNDSKEDGY